MSEDFNNNQQASQSPPPGDGQQPQPQYGQPQYPPQGEPPMTGILEAYKSYWQNYANFNDRTSRAGYWWVFLINNIIGSVLYILLLAPAMAAGMAAAAGSGGNSIGIILFMFTGANIVFLIWGLANLIPSLALIVRRLHDTGKNWVYILFYLIPFVGWIILIVFLATATKYPPENRFYGLRRVA